MLMRLVSVAITLSAFMMLTLPANAEPNSCKNSAITIAESEAVSILQNMHTVQLNLEMAEVSLNKLSQQKNVGYNSSDANSVNHYNDLVNKYNDAVNQRNKISNHYNHLKDSFNAITQKISPSRNHIFITCINSELSILEANTVSINTDVLNRDIESLKH